MLTMLPSLISRLRDHIRRLERDHSRVELESYWTLLAEAEHVVYRDTAAKFPQEAKEIEDKLKKVLGVKQ
jgi:hypothetical protein